MFDSLWHDIKYRVRVGGFWTQIIIINISVWLVVQIIRAYFNFNPDSSTLVSFSDIIHRISVSSDIREIAWRPWTLVTHIFLHEGFWHLLWNCLALYWFSQIVEDLIGRKRSKIVFFESALAGIIFFVVSAKIIPWYSHTTLYAQGCSAAVCGLLFAAATLSPNYQIRLLLFGDVSIKYIALAVLILDLVFATQMNNTGGHFAHIGGSLWGYSYVRLLRAGVHVDFFVDWFKPKTKPGHNRTITREFKPRHSIKTNKEEFNLDSILDKISQKGMDSLSADEKKFLDKISRQ